MKEDPIKYAERKLIKMIDQIDEANKSIDYLKNIIRVYFSDNLQTDESPMGAMKRNQIRKELLEFARE
jgi:hypothetical protein